MTVEVICGDAVNQLSQLPDESVHCCVTSPPYWGLRDYGTDGQLGLEPTPEEYVARMVDVFVEVRRVLRDDGTLWLNLGDSYCSDSKWGGSSSNKNETKQGYPRPRSRGQSGLKDKDLCGIPWRVAFALQADGWYLRSDIIWSKPNPMPESVTDRPTKSHEYLFLLAQSRRYYYDADAIKEPATGRHPRNSPDNKHEAAYHDGDEKMRTRANLSRIGAVQMRNRRSVWSVPTQPFSGAHFAVFPPKLIEPCIKAGCPEGGIVLDPFGGAGTTGLVADRLGRDAILIELNPKYCEMARGRIRDDAPLFNQPA